MDRLKLSPTFFSWDHLGMLLSFLCLIHCLLLPSFIALLPTVGLEIFKNAMVHKVLAVGVSAVSLFAFLPGVRLHKKLYVPVLALIGIAFILGAVLYEPVSCCDVTARAMTTIGGIFLIVAHVLNRTFCRSCLKCQDQTEDSCEATQ